MARDHTTGRKFGPSGQKTSDSRVPTTNATESPSIASDDEALVEKTHDISLETLRAQGSTTPVEERSACPNCGSLKVHAKSTKPAVRQHPEDYRCHGCESHFDEPDIGTGGSA
jgi:predicted RNA-binding Zn-ribbon protein involved in translation (DUF1610 family)